MDNARYRFEQASFSLILNELPAEGQGGLSREEQRRGRRNRIRSVGSDSGEKRSRGEQEREGRGRGILSEARVARIARVQGDNRDAYQFEFNSQSFPACSRFISHLSGEQHTAPIRIQMKTGNSAVETERSIEILDRIA